MLRKKDYEAERFNEICYGRKTWAIERYFAYNSDPTDEEGVYNVPESAWESFHESVRPYIVVLEWLLDKYDELDGKEELEDNEYEWALYNGAYEVIESVLDKIFDGDSYMLGADWEARVVIDWYYKYDEIMKLYSKGEEIVMLASY